MNLTRVRGILERLMPGHSKRASRQRTRLRWRVIRMRSQTHAIDPRRRATGSMSTRAGPSCRSADALHEVDLAVAKLALCADDVISRVRDAATRDLRMPQYPALGRCELLDRILLHIAECTDPGDRYVSTRQLQLDNIRATIGDQCRQLESKEKKRTKRRQI